MVNVFKSISSGLNAHLRKPAVYQILRRAFSEETCSRYGPGGYHSVRIGDVFNDGRCKVVCKLGYSIHSTVWLVFDARREQHVALKILTADCYGAGRNTFEVDILTRIKQQHEANPRGTRHVLGLLDNFRHHGPNGAHVCLVFKAMGPDMSEYRRLFRGNRIPIPVMKIISKQLLQALAFLHNDCQIIHCDIKPQNIMIETQEINEMFKHAPSSVFTPSDDDVNELCDYYVRSTPIVSGEEDLSQATDISVRLSDFGTGKFALPHPCGISVLTCHVASYFDRHLTEWIQPDMLRAPEVILGAAWDHKVDIWNLGLIIWELAEGALVFDGTWTATAPYTADAHLAQMEAVLGKMPKSLLARSPRSSQYYDENGKLLRPSTFGDKRLSTICANPTLDDEGKQWFLEMIESMVQLEPRDRPDARSLLQSRWLQ